MLSVSHVFLGDWRGEVNFQKSEVCEVGWFSYSETLELDVAFAYSEALKDLFDVGLIE